MEFEMNHADTDNSTDAVLASAYEMASHDAYNADLDMNNGTNDTNVFWTVYDSPYNPTSWFDVIFCILIVLGIIGNSLVIHVQRHLSGSRIGGGRATNRLIIGLAVSDMLAAIFFVPLPKFADVPSTAAGEFYCRVVKTQICAWICFMGSVYTLTTISLERYLAIAHPFAYKEWIRRRRYRNCFIFIWTAAVAINVPFIVYHAVDDVTGKCRSTYPSERSRMIYGVFLFLIEYFGPLCLMVYTSMRSIFILRRLQHGQPSVRVRSGSTSPNHKNSTPSRAEQKLRRHFTVMFIVIFSSFMILWTPDQVGFLLQHLKVISYDYNHTVHYHIYFLIAFLSSTAINPVIYSVCLPNFRRALVDVILCRGMGHSYMRTRTTEKGSAYYSSEV